MSARGYRVAILAGGQGTRLRARSGDLPKPMVPVAGKPLLEHHVELCRRHGFCDILLLLHYKHEVVSAHFGNGAAFGVRIGYAVETSPRGTAGALRDALPRLAPRFLLLYGDTFMDVDLRRIWRAHAEHGADATLLLHPNDHPDDSDLVALNRSGWVQRVFPYPHPDGVRLRNLVNAALYVVERDGLAEFAPAQGRADVAKDMFPAMLAAGRRLFGHVTPEYIKDAGTPERLDKVEADIESGVVDRLSTRQLRSAVFLDRDGTINEEVSHLSDPAQVRLIDGAADAIRRLNRAGRLAVVTTNQPVLARGDVDEEGLDRIHAQLDALLGQGGAYLDGIYVCPHHPDRGFPGEVAALKRLCECRKPEPGLLDQACRELLIDRRASWMVGDTTADIEAGRRAGVRTILVCTGHAGRDGKCALQPDYVVPDLAAAVDWVLVGHGRLASQMQATALACSTGVRIVLLGSDGATDSRHAAQVLKELVQAAGRTAHVLSAQALVDAADPAAPAGLATLLLARRRFTLSIESRDALSGAPLRHPIESSIGSEDLLLVHGGADVLQAPWSTLPQEVVLAIQVSPHPPHAVRSGEHR